MAGDADAGAQTVALQRYVMAVLFFTMHLEVLASTAPHATITSHTVSSRENEDDGRQRELSRLTFVDWMTASSVCLWEGIICDAQNAIMSLDLSNSRLEGTLPPELGLLGSSIYELDLSHNMLYGSVPTEGWAQLTGLGKYQAKEI